MTKTIDNNLSRRVRSPEDLRLGDHVAVTHTVCELLPDTVEAWAGGKVELLRATYMPNSAGEPVKVVALSLPFVMAQTINGVRFAIDTRQHALVWVGDAYAKAARDKPRRSREGKKATKRKGKGKGKGKGRKNKK